MLVLKSRVCPEIFHCIEYTYNIQDFWAICACSEKESVSWIYCIEYVFFIVQDIWATLRLPWKTELPWNFSLYWSIFYHSGFLRNLRLPWKQSLHWKFLRRGACRPLDPSPRTPMSRIENRVPRIRENYHRVPTGPYRVPDIFL